MSLIGLLLCIAAIVLPTREDIWIQFTGVSCKNCGKKISRDYGFYVGDEFIQVCSLDCLREYLSPDITLTFI